MKFRLGDSHLWQGKAGQYEIEWCELCQTFQIGCLNPECRGSSCNGGGCEQCVADHLEFLKAKHCPESYLSEAEKKVLAKVHLLKRYIPASLAKGESEINWARLKREGKLSEHAEEVFKDEIFLSEIIEDFPC